MTGLLVVPTASTTTLFFYVYPHLLFAWQKVTFKTVHSLNKKLVYVTYIEVNTCTVQTGTLYIDILGNKYKGYTNLSVTCSVILFGFGLF